MNSKKIYHKKISIPTVTIAICALNESANIKPLLESIKMQKETGFILEKILLISDGSTDKTVELAVSIGLKKLVIKDYKQRIGKSSRLNEIYSTVDSDIVVQPDADVILGHEYVIRDMVKPFLESPRIGMTGGHPMPLKAQTYLEKAVNCTLEVYIPFRKKLNSGNNILSATGRLLALRREVFRNIKVPKDTIANDGFVYFCNLMQVYQYRYASSALVYFRSPQNLRDHISQNTRFMATKQWMKQYFPESVVNREYHIPEKELRAAMMNQFLKYPILSAYIFIINRYCDLRAKILKKKINAIWDIVYSTKKLKSYDK